MVPYGTTENTFDNKDVRAEVLRELLEEFSSACSSRSNSRCVPNHQASTSIPASVSAAAPRTMNNPSDDYSAFFGELHTLLVSKRKSGQPRPLLCPPQQRHHGRRGGDQRRPPHLRLDCTGPPAAGLFRFKTTTEEVEQELREFISSRNEDLLHNQDLILKVCNQVHTLLTAQVQDAGTIHQRRRARRGCRPSRRAGRTGAANEVRGRPAVHGGIHGQREFINKWGFWGLILFVWIPFMASGVIVGSMLGTLSRMKFMRVLWAVVIGGSAACDVGLHRRWHHPLHACLQAEAMIPSPGLFSSLTFTCVQPNHAVRPSCSKTRSWTTSTPTCTPSTARRRACHGRRDPARRT